MLLDDYLNGRIRGFNGGWDNAVRFGLSYDSRDFEPNPGAASWPRPSSR